MTKMEMALLFGNMGAGALSSAVGANQTKKNQAQQELDAMVQRQLAALQNSQQTSQNLQDQRQQGWKDQTSQSPLGQEQSYSQKQRLAQVLLPQIANFKSAMPTDAGVAGAYVPPTNFLGALGNPKLLETFGDQATATSLADRRKLMAGLNPDYEFSSLGNFGLDSSFDQGVDRAQQDAAGRRSAYENTQTSLANQQYNLASQPQQQQQQEKKGGGVKGFLGGLLKTAAPFASFIPGVGPLAAIGLGAAGGALGNKLQGGGLVSGAAQGAIGAGVGAAGKSLAGGQGLNPFNNGAGRVMNNAMTSASLPVGNMVSQQAQVGLPSTGFDMTRTIMGGLTGNNPSQQSGGGGSRPPAIGPVQGPSMPPSGFSSQGYPLAAAGPYTGPGSTPNQIGRAPSGIPGVQPNDPNFRSAPEGMDPVAQRAFEDLMNSGIGRGYSEGGWNIGGVGRGALTGVMSPAPKALPAGQYNMGPSTPKPYYDTTATNWPAQAPKQLGAGAQPKLLTSGPQLPKQLGSGQYDMGPIGSTSPAQGSTFNLPKFSPSNMENQQNAMNILNQLSKMPREKAAEFLATPQGQAVLQQLPRAASPYAGLSPQQMMQMVVRGGG